MNYLPRTAHANGAAPVNLPVADQGIDSHRPIERL
jgi:hypothetical protein